MKIGILTFSRTHNFGAILQCFALQQTLKDLGHEVLVIDYKQPYIESTNRPFSWSIFRDKLLSPMSLFRYTKSIIHRLLSEKRFESFKKKFVSCTMPCTETTIPQDFEAYLIGSDQVWSIDCTSKYDLVFWGQFKRKRNTKLFSYAISTNMKSLNTIRESSWNKILNEFNNLSFREKNTSDYIKHRTNRNVSVNIDPTLLLERNAWNRILDSKIQDGKYILVYQVRRIPGKENTLNNYATQLASKMECKVVNLTYDYSPQEFVSLFCYATYVITSSFHGSVFGLIFNKPMSVVCLGDGHDDRYVNLLKSVGAESALMKINEIFNEKTIDYELVNKKLDKLRMDSLLYLKTILQ